MLSPYLISNKLRQEVSRQSVNDSTLLDENNRLIRENKIRAGEPLSVERPNPILERSTALSLLRKYTYAPNKAYGYLFNIDNGLTDFITYQNDFDKLIKGRSNMSAEDFIKEFNYFQDIEMKKPEFLKRTKFASLDERERYEKIIEEMKTQQRISIQDKEEEERAAIIKYQGEERARTIGKKRRNEDKDRIIKELNEKARLEFQKANEAERVYLQEEYFNNYTKLISLRDRVLKENNPEKITELYNEAKDILSIKGSGYNNKRKFYWFAYR